MFEVKDVPVEEEGTRPCNYRLQCAHESQEGGARVGEIVEEAEQPREQHEGRQ